MLVYNVGFINTEGKYDETQIDVEEYNQWSEEIVEMFNLILSLQKEMGIKEIKYIDFLECDDEEEEC